MGSVWLKQEVYCLVLKVFSYYKSIFSITNNHVICQYVVNPHKVCVHVST